MAKRKKGKNQREGRGVDPVNRVEIPYRRDLFRIVGTVQDRILSLARLIERGMIGEDQARGEIDRIMVMSEGFTARRSAEKFISNGSETHANQLNDVFRKSFGIDVLELIQDIPTRRLLNRKITENVNLITKMQRGQINGIRKAVISNYRGEELPEGRSLIEQIKHVGDVTKSRAKLIARDQTSKLNGDLNRVRQTGLGIQEYRWQTSQDERVVGKPGGKYPEGNRKHMNHWERHNKIFRWDSPPPDGHPGEPINDRCKARPIIDVRQIAELKKKTRRKAA